MPRRPNAWPGPGCACTSAKPLSAIAPAAPTANSFRFISLIFFLSDFPSALFCASRLMTDRVKRRLQIFICARQFQPRSTPRPAADQRHALGTNGSTYKVVTVTRHCRSLEWCGCALDYMDDSDASALVQAALQHDE